MAACWLHGSACVIPMCSMALSLPPLLFGSSRGRLSVMEVSAHVSIPASSILIYSPDSSLQRLSAPSAPGIMLSVVLLAHWVFALGFRRSRGSSRVVIVCVYLNHYLVTYPVLLVTYPFLFVTYPFLFVTVNSFFSSDRGDKKLRTSCIFAVLSRLWMISTTCTTSYPTDTSTWQ